MMAPSGYGPVRRPSIACRTAVRFHSTHIRVSASLVGQHERRIADRNLSVANCAGVVGLPHGFLGSEDLDAEVDDRGCALGADVGGDG
jgi:hypothetical protein